MLGSLGVSVRESLLNVKEDGTVSIPVDNFQCLCARLKSGMELGKVQRVYVKDCEEDMSRSIECKSVDVVEESSGSVCATGGSK